jgi:sigma-B regulation protein RsbU (phosphoserine phosphatase)
MVPKKSMLLCYTDGLTEVFNKEEDEYGLENTIKFLQHSRYMNLQTLHRELLEDIKVYNDSAGFDDDITLLSCRFK